MVSVSSLYQLVVAGTWRGYGREAVVVVGAVVVVEAVASCLALDPQSSSAGLGAGALPCPTQCVTGVGSPDGVLGVHRLMRGSGVVVVGGM